MSVGIAKQCDACRGYGESTTSLGQYARQSAYTQQANSVLQIQLSSSEQNTLLVGSTANLAGSLSIELVNGFVPQPSDNFAILSAGNLMNTFAGLPDGSHLATAGTAGSFEVDYDYANNRVRLSNFMVGIAGDFDGDGDGDVDGRDFLLWQRNPSVGSLSGWLTNYGTNALTASNVAVPEPTALVLLGFAILAGSARRLPF